MRKNGKKLISAITSIAMAVTMLPATVALNQVKAEETNVELKPWSVYHSPKYMEINAGEKNNEGVVNSFVTSKGESAKGLDAEASEQTISTTNPADGFTIDIANTGWDKVWNNDTINPWSVKAEMNDIEIIPWHKYSISFKAKASKKKYAYMFGYNETNDILEKDTNRFIVIGTEDNTYTVEFSNYICAEKFSFGLLLGAFNSFNDFDGSSLIEKGLTETEFNWSGAVDVSDFKIVDEGWDPEYLPYTITVDSKELKGALVYLTSDIVHGSKDTTTIILQSDEGRYFEQDPELQISGAKVIGVNRYAGTIEYEISEFIEDTIVRVKGETQKTQEQLLKEKKEEAINEIENYVDLNNYRANEQAIIKLAISSGKNTINSATTIEEVDNELIEIKKIIDSMKTDAQYREEEGKTTTEKEPEITTNQETTTVKEPEPPTKPETTTTIPQETTTNVVKQSETTTAKSDNAVANNTNNNVVQPTTTNNVQPKADITESRTDSKVEIIKNTKAKVKSVKPMKKSLKLSWKKSKEADGYQVQISLKTSFAKARTINVNKGAALGTTIKGLKAKKKYYIRMRSYVVANGTKVYSKWSKVIIKKTK